VSKRHITQVVRDQHGDYYGTCLCGQNSGPNRFSEVQRWRAEDWVNEHTESVQHALAVLHRANGSLKIERDHAAKMLADPNTPAADKAMWQILFDGADRRLADSGPPDPTTDGLW
jgi:hypothetical protein